MSDALEALLAELDDCTFSFDGRAKMEAIRDRIRAALEQGEPSVWIMQFPGDAEIVTHDRCCADRWKGQGFDITPLYTAPPSTAEAQARALEEFAMKLKQLSQRNSGMLSNGLLHAATYAEAEAKRIREEG